MATGIRRELDVQPTCWSVACPRERRLIGVCLLLVVWCAGCDSGTPPERELASLEKQVKDLKAERAQFERLVAHYEEANTKLTQRIKKVNASADEAAEALSNAETRIEQAEARLKVLEEEKQSEAPTPEQADEPAGTEEGSASAKSRSPKRSRREDPPVPKEMGRFVVDLPEPERDAMGRVQPSKTTLTGVSVDGLMRVEINFPVHPKAMELFTSRMENDKIFIDYTGPGVLGVKGVATVATVGVEEGNLYWEWLGTKQSVRKLGLLKDLIGYSSLTVYGPDDEFWTVQFRQPKSFTLARSLEIQDFGGMPEGAEVALAWVEAPNWRPYKTSVGSRIEIRRTIPGTATRFYLQVAHRKDTVEVASSYVQKRHDVKAAEERCRLLNTRWKQATGTDRDKLKKAQEEARMKVVLTRKRAAYAAEEAKEFEEGKLHALLKVRHSGVILADLTLALPRAHTDKTKRGRPSRAPKLGGPAARKRTKRK